MGLLSGRLGVVDYGMFISRSWRSRWPFEGPRGRIRKRIGEGVNLAADVEACLLRQELFPELGCVRRC